MKLFSFNKISYSLILSIMMTSGMSLIDIKYNFYDRRQRDFNNVLAQPLQKTSVIFDDQPSIFEAQNQTISEAETTVIKDIISYQWSHGVESKLVPSRSLMAVARLHAKDLADNHPEHDQCNLHSWSKQGFWTPFCYTSNHKNGSYMWNKPREITQRLFTQTYSGNGFELAYYGPSPAHAIEGWKNSPSHRDVILQIGLWSSYKWKSMGVGVAQGYVVLWLGKENDPNGYLSF